MSKNFCVWIQYPDYYETGCANQIEEGDYEPIQPIFCPYCGDKITVEEN